MIDLVGLTAQRIADIFSAAAVKVLLLVDIALAAEQAFFYTHEAFAEHETGALAQ